MRKIAAGRCIALSACLFAGCTSAGDRDVVATVPTPVTADDAWREQPGGQTLAALVEEFGVDQPSAVFTESLDCAGCAGPATQLQAVIERPGKSSNEIVEDIQGMALDGLAPFVGGLIGTRDGYHVEIGASDRDGKPGVTILVIVPPT